MLEGGKTSRRSTRIGETPVFAGVFPLATVRHSAGRTRPTASSIGGSGQVEVYTDAPELAEMPGVPKGKLLPQKPWESKIYPNTTRPWWIYVPAQYKEDQPACVMVFQDGGGYTSFVPTVFDNLIAKGEMPVTVAVFINPGSGAAKKAAASAASNTTRSPTVTRGSCSKRSCPRPRRP